LNDALHNLILLQFFNEFCLQEYQIENVMFWIEAEIYKTVIEPVNARKFANYLRLVYLTKNSPLGINLNNELLEDICWSPDETPPSDIFVEVQHYVFNTIKGHAFPRFIKSKLYSSFTAFQNSDYQEAQVVAWDERYVSEKYGNMFEVIDILQDPSSETSKVLLNEGKYGAISTLLFRQRLLSDIYGRYFPVVSPVIKGYFDELKRDIWKGKKAHVEKGKKLTKFFGKRPTEQHMIAQSNPILASDTHRESVQSMHNSKAAHSAQHIKPPAAGSSSPDSNLHRRKKVGKLNEFFGENLDESVMVAQKLVTTLNLHENNLGSNEGDLNNATINELTAEERRELTRRARKILKVLGATLDEQSVGVLKGGLQIASKAENYGEVLSSQNMLQNDSGSLSGSQDVDVKQVQLTRLNKLSHFLGHRIQDSDLEASCSNSNSKLTPRPLTNDEKLEYKKRASKLESILGKTVAPQSILSYSDKKAKFDLDVIIRLNDDELLPIDDMFSSDEEQADGNKKKMNKLKKLRKLLGNDVRVGTVLKKQFLDQLASSVEAIEDLENRSELQKSIDMLKSIAEIRITTPTG
jgi:Regulator of G protein signaling domain